jgi:hypothetical protein
VSQQRDPIERLVRQRIEQGFSKTCSDPVVISRVASIIGPALVTQHSNGIQKKKIAAGSTPRRSKEASRVRSQTSRTA